jgi:hypothetical protein
VIEELVNFLTGDVSTESTSPVYVAVNTTDMRAALGIGVSQRTKIYRGQAQAISYPYVLFYERIPGDRGLGGNTILTYSETHVMMVECGAIGDSDIQAKRRSGYLRLAVEAQLEVNKQAAKGLLTRQDLGGTLSADTISNWVIDLRNPEPRTSGPGLQVTTTQWTAKSVIRVLVQVKKRRSTQ